MTISMTFFWFPPYLGRRIGGNLMPALLPSIYARVVGLGPPLFSVLANARAVGEGTGGSPIK
jgi:hypothetical protein